MGLHCTYRRPKIPSMADNSQDAVAPPEATYFQITYTSATQNLDVVSKF